MKPNDTTLPFIEAGGEQLIRISKHIKELVDTPKYVAYGGNPSSKAFLHLILTLKKKWFDMIWEDIKTEEYRELKPWMITRLFDWRSAKYKSAEDACHNFYVETLRGDVPHLMNFKKHYDFVTFQHGYNNPRIMHKKYGGFEYGRGKKEWGALPKKDYFKIKLLQL